MSDEDAKKSTLIPNRNSRIPSGENGGHTFMIAYD